MKLSDKTLGVLKNYANINQGLMFKKGKVLKTVSSHKNILSEATISEDIPADFGVYDLNNFLSVVSLDKDNPSFEFDDKHVMIVGMKGRSKIKYRFCEPTMIVLPPEKDFVMPEAEINCLITNEDFDWIMKASSVLSSPHIAIQSDGITVDVVAFNEIQKIVRKSFNPLHDDSYKDTAGYASIGYEKVQQIKRNQRKK